ncbi:hypothetical protein FOQG_19273 [Fusarium oxysporum f. sp. raphani 54005]|uniref:Uncharacterized protein n=2 Tax=Fusarium oxysporum TaxID=5507 RepID=X0BBS7_FUSOX|nr:hypothetical protein FOQG_19273 [Fusarium oxysporum f. sp. raphani 54005]EXL63825.1 hypothetical protein FOPG_19903 [Fusarium oxysporum f. sp. conglutinans race 2 54008]
MLFSGLKPWTATVRRSMMNCISTASILVRTHMEMKR